MHGASAEPAKQGSVLSAARNTVNAVPVACHFMDDAGAEERKWVSSPRSSSHGTVTAPRFRAARPHGAAVPRLTAEARSSVWVT